MTGGASGEVAAIRRIADDTAPAATPATHEIVINGVRRDALSVQEIAPRLFGSSGEADQQRVRELIANGRLYAFSTGRWWIPVSSYVAFLRGEPYPGGVDRP